VIGREQPTLAASEYGLTLDGLTLSYKTLVRLVAAGEDAPMATPHTTGILCVTSTLSDLSAADAFQEWYDTEHIPDVRKALVGVRRVQRWRSLTEEGIYTAVYEFETEQQVLDALGSAEIKELIAEFDRRWGAVVVRTRAGHAVVASS
jgi:hypothetical protein